MRHVVTRAWIAVFAVIALAPAARAEMHLLTTDTVISASDTSYDGDDVIVDGATLTIEGDHVFGELILRNGAVLTHPPESAAPPVLGAVRMVIESSASVDLTGKGLLKNEEVTGWSGGSHGGRGGGAGSNGQSNPTSGNYQAPVSFGVGGFSLARGGGAVKLVTDELHIDGDLLAKGGSQSGATQAGGAGGSIWIDTGSLTGSGSIDASGGAAWAGGFGGGGGGGRIAIFYDDASGFDLAMKVVNAGGAAGLMTVQSGGAGTVYLKSSAEPLGELRIANPALPAKAASTDIGGDFDHPIHLHAAIATVADGSSLATVVGSDGGQLRLEGAVSGDVIDLQGIAVTMLAAADADSNRLAIVANRLLVDTQATIDVTGKGLPAAGATGNSGGSYGGSGGASLGITNATYGDERLPELLFGSGGAGGTRGGGAVDLLVSELVLDGAVLARGESRTTGLGGGGSGGSIRLNVGVLSGNGHLDASGGNTVVGGGGGGGRIAVYYGDAASFGLATNLASAAGTGTAGVPTAGSVLTESGPAEVLAVTPNGAVSQVTGLTIAFSAPIDAATFALADDIALDGPAGAVTPTGLTRLSPLDFRVELGPLPEDGTYTLHVGPDIFTAGGDPVDDVFVASFTLDRVNPTAPNITSHPPPELGLEATANVTLAGEREAGTSIWIDGDEQVALGSGNWSALLSLSENVVNTVSVFARDEAGNDSATVTVDIRVDTIPPGASGVLIPASGSFSSSSPPSVRLGHQEQGSGLDLGATSMELRRGPVIVVGTLEDADDLLTFVPALPLVEGDYSLTTTLVDLVGLSSVPLVHAFTLDFTAPASPSVNPTPSETNAATLDLAGTKEPGTGIWLNGVEIVPVHEGTGWSGSLALALGDNAISLTSRDRAGNVSPPVERVVRYDDLAPAAVVVAVDANGNGTSAQLDWTTYDEIANGGDIDHYEVLLAASAFTDPASATLVDTVAAGTQAFVLSGLTRGVTQAVAVRAVDRSGNRAATVSSTSFTPSDVVAPGDVNDLALEVGATSVTLTWTPPANDDGDLAGYNVFFGSDPGEALAVADTSYTRTGLALASAHDVRVVARDVDGNASAGAEVVAVTLLPNPGGLQVSPRNGMGLLSWSPVAPAQHVQSFRIYVSDSDFADVTGLTPRVTVEGDRLDAGVAALENGQPYWFAVTTVNASGGEDPLVSTQEATPAADTDGPVVSDVRLGADALVGGETVTEVVTVSASATDISGVSRVEFLLVDEGTIGVDTNGTDGYAVTWDVYDTEDGPYTLRVVAYDTLNQGSVPQDYAVSVALGAPTVSAIDSPLDGHRTGDAFLRVSGRADPRTEVQLHLGAEPIGNPIPIGGNGLFERTIELAPGENDLRAEAVNRGGSTFSPITQVTFDTAVPETPVAVKAVSQPDGRIRVQWRRGGEGSPAGYHVYRAGAPFDDLADAVKVNSERVTYLLHHDLPPADGTYYYRVVAADDIDAQEVTSAPSVMVSAASDREPPRASIAYAPEGPVDEASGRIGRGVVVVTLEASEPLEAIPFVSITPEGGAPIPLELHEVGESSYEGTFEITDTTPTATAYALFSGNDLAGNQGFEVDLGGTIEIDARGPTVTGLTVVPEQPIRNDSDSPVAVNFVLTLDEALPAGSSPTLTYLLSGESRTPTAAGTLTRVDDLTWQGGFVLPDDAGQAAPETFSFDYLAVDDLGNESSELDVANQFQVYQGALPPLALPTGFAATALPDGGVRLEWQPVEGASAYAIHHRAPSATELSMYPQQPTEAVYVDVPGEDGLHAYAVASVRRHGGAEAASALSPVIEVAVDSIAPDAPASLAVALSGSGVDATWEAPPPGEPVTYRLYRGAGPGFDVQGATLVLDALAATAATDASPADGERHYRVVAVDAAGNESLPSDSATIGVEVLPVANLAAELVDGMPPSLTWTHSGTGIVGFNIYLGEGAESLKLNAVPVTSPPYADTGHAGDERVYTVKALGADLTESMGRVLRLPRIVATLDADAVLERHVVNRLDYEVSNPGDSPVTGLRLHVDVDGYEHRSDPFSLGAGDDAIVPVVVGGYADLAALSPITTTIELDPVPGERIRIRESGNLAVTDGVGLLVGLAAESFTRGGDGIVRLTLENASEVQIDVVLARGFGADPSGEVLLELLDEDGNLLSSAEVLQADGPGIVALADGTAVARIAPGAIFTSSDMVLPVPAAAPDTVKARITVDRLHHRLGETDHVAIAGIVGNVEASLIDTAYTGTIDSVTPELSDGDEEILITGRALTRDTELPLGSTPLVVAIASDGFERTYDVTTDSAGTYRLRFTPLPGEGGVYRASAVHPDLDERPEQWQFTIARLLARPGILNLRTSRHLDQPLSIEALAGPATTVTNLRLEYVAEAQPGGTLAPGIQVTLPDPVDLAPSASAPLNVILRADDTAPDAGTLVLRGLSDEGGAEPALVVTVNYTLEDAEALLQPVPAFLDTGVVHGGNLTDAIVLRNVGLVDTGTVLLKLLTDRNEPAPDWIRLVSAESQDPIAVGEERRITVQLSPSVAVAEGQYEFNLRVFSGGEAFNVPLFASVTQAGVGAAQFHVSDLYTDLEVDGVAPNGLEGATIYMEKEHNPGINQTMVTDVDGIALFEDLPAGWYKFRASAPDHQEVIYRLQVKSGVTVDREVFLNYNLVTIEWFVREIGLEDRYEIVLDATYETDVPAAVVVAEPESVTLPDMDPGDVYYGEFTLTNYGLIRAENLEVALPRSDGFYRFEMINGLPDSLEAGEQMRVAYRAVMLQPLDSDTGGEAGGGGCGSRNAGCFRGGYGYECANGSRGGGQATHCAHAPLENCGGGPRWGGAGGGGGPIGADGVAIAGDGVIAFVLSNALRVEYVNPGLSPRGFSFGGGGDYAGCGADGDLGFGGGPAGTAGPGRPAIPIRRLQAGVPAVPTGRAKPATPPGGC